MVETAVPPMEQKEQIDLSTAKVIKEARHPTDQIMTKEMADAYTKGQLPELVPQSPPPASVAAQAPPTKPTTPGVAPAAVPQQVPLAQQGEPPVKPTDSDRVKTRINRLYGQMRQAEESADVYAQENQQLRAQLASAPQAPTSQPAQYGYVPPPDAPAYPVNSNLGQPAYGTPDAGDFVSRQDLNRMFGQMTQALQAQHQLADSQRASRSEAELEFPELFTDPAYRQTVDTIMAQDAGLRQDPSGPYKASLLARGMRDMGPGPETAIGDASADARKQALTGVGPSIPEGTQSSNDQAARYQEALSIAKRSGQDADFVRMMMIRHGKA